MWFWIFFTHTKLKHKSKIKKIKKLKKKHKKKKKQCKQINARCINA